MPVTTLGPGEITHRWPQFLPGSQAVLFTSSKQQGSYDDASIEVVSLKTGQRRTIHHGGFFPRYLPTSSAIGHLVYMRDASLFAVPFDPDRLALRGPLVPILEDVSNSVGAGADFVVAGPPFGPATFVYLAGKGLLGGWAISLLDRTGNVEALHAALGFYWTPRFSPDGKRLAFSMTSAQSEDIWVKDLDRDTPSRLSFFAGLNRWPTWSPDGNSIVFQSTNTTAPGLYWIRSDGSGEPLRLSDGKLNESPYSFSPDGKHLAFTRTGNGGSSDIFIAPIEGDSSHPRLGRPELFLGTPFSELYPAFSPDGRWLAYESNETGTPEVHVRSFPGPGGRWQVSTGGGLLPLWSREGRELLFQTFDRRVMAMGYTVEGDSFMLGKSRVWSEIHLQNLNNAASNYDVAPNGKLAVMLASGATTEKPPTHLSVLLNFSDELRRRAPPGK